ncbi:ABC transporter permease [Streptococcus cuniculipharyngis]|uniref:FtsX-like permease family protein n=1 Tax=Streptococcus cuniculipharyngis TaxID=1562651 RepID=A0A5C5SDB1_9STRE|nr:ABC transporter permease [Streptococcus cuniculipharyngis]TWS99077.1 FtsX-like permease family protein [Streptococcus cuniculipharyngis]
MQNWKFAISSILGHKMRSFLTMLGVIIGVAAVSVVMAIGTGVTKSITKQASQSQHDVRLFYQKKGDNAFYPEDVGTNVKSPLLREEWLQQIAKEIPGISGYYATNSTTAAIAYQNKRSSQVTVTGVNSTYFGIKKYKILAGRQLGPSDYRQFSRLIMIDKVLAKKLFTSYDAALNQTVDVGNKKYRVVGVYKDPAAGSSIYGASSEGNAILANTQLAAEFNVPEISSVYFYVPDVLEAPTVGKQAGKRLTELSGAKEGEFTMFDISQMLEAIKQQVGTMTLFIGFIGGISLFVGGIGVMNIMLVSVTERTREIGLRKALGATRRNILVQFLIESVVLTVLGGIIGLIIAYAISAWLGSLPSLVQNLGKPEISLTTVLISIAFSALVGVVFGVLPASKASKLDPIEALRYE